MTNLTSNSIELKNCYHSTGGLKLSKIGSVSAN